MDIKEYHLRPKAEFKAEQAYLQKRVEIVEKGLGRVAAKLAPGALSQPMDALDRARELTNQMIKQVRVRPLEEAVAAQKDWLHRAKANHAQAAEQGEPALGFNRIELDLRLLDEILDGWKATKN